MQGLSWLFETTGLQSFNQNDFYGFEAVYSLYLRFQERDPEGELPGGAVQYWVSRLDDPRQSQVAQMGVELMSIPSMSDEPECEFRSAKFLISDRRNRVRDDIIQASECRKSWVQQGLIFGTMESDMVQMEQMLKDLALMSE